MNGCKEGWTARMGNESGQERKEKEKKKEKTDEVQRGRVRGNKRIDIKGKIDARNV